MSRRIWPALAAVVLLAVGAAVLLLAPDTPAPSRAEQAEALARELRCPDCQALSVADSPTESAAEIRRQIDEMLAAGATAAEVREHFTTRYGDWILLAPRAPAAWIVPLLVVSLAALGLAVWVVSGRGAPPAVAGPMSAAERRQVHDEAEALDA